MRPLHRGHACGLPALFVHGKGGGPKNEFTRGRVRWLPASSPSTRRVEPRPELLANPQAATRPAGEPGTSPGAARPAPAGRTRPAGRCSAPVVDVPVTDLQVRTLGEDERGWLRDLLTERWGAPIAVGRDRRLGRRRPAGPGGRAGPGARRSGDVRRGAPRRRRRARHDRRAEGAARCGPGLVEAVAARSRRKGARTLRVMTTNDNLRALRFYQRLGFVIGVVRVGQVGRRPPHQALDPAGGARRASRSRDEIDLEMTLPLARA